MQPDPKIIRKCLKQDRRAQQLLYKDCFAVLMGICSRYYKNKDESVAALNMGFLKILKSLDKRKENVPFKAWISRIMINTIIDEYRKTRTYKERISPVDFAEPHEEPEPVHLNDAEMNLDAEDVEQMLLQLPPTTRRVFNLYAIDGYSHDEVAELLQMKPGTSKWHVSTARKQLTAWLRVHQPHLVPSKAVNE